MNRRDFLRRSIAAVASPAVVALPLPFIAEAANSITPLFKGEIGELTGLTIRHVKEVKTAMNRIAEIHGFPVDGEQWVLMVRPSAFNELRSWT